MTDGEAILRGILDHPGDDVRRLVYADWLEETGQGERAEFIRVQAEVARILSDTPDLETAGYQERHPNRCREVRGRLSALRRRERDLWETSSGDGWLIPDPIPQPAHVCLEADTMALAETVGDALPVLVFRRGFVSRVRLPLAAWLAHGPALVRAHPIERVEVTDKRPEEGAAPQGHVVWWADMRPDDNGTLPFRLPWDVFDLLRGGARYAPSDKFWERGSRLFSHVYPSPGVALDALSSALLAHARRPQEVPTP